MIIATSIKTNLWNTAIEFLIKDGWTVTYKYDDPDAGIDSDFIILEKENEEVLFGWDNWFEGEIKCTQGRMKSIEKSVNADFNKGEPINLKPSVIDIHLKWRNENKWNNLRFKK
jgi:hypothetical protein